LALELTVLQAAQQIADALSLVLCGSHADRRGAPQLASLTGAKLSDTLRDSGPFGFYGMLMRW
jgi:hypothetical protein